MTFLNNSTKPLGGVSTSKLLKQQKQQRGLQQHKQCDQTGHQYDKKQKKENEEQKQKQKRKKQKQERGPKNEKSKTERSTKVSTLLEESGSSLTSHEILPIYEINTNYKYESSFSVAPSDDISQILFGESVGSPDGYKPPSSPLKPILACIGADRDRYLSSSIDNKVAYYNIPALSFDANEIKTHPTDTSDDGIIVSDTINTFRNSKLISVDADDINSDNILPSIVLSGEPHSHIISPHTELDHHFNASSSCFVHQNSRLLIDEKLINGNQKEQGNVKMKNYQQQHQQHEKQHKKLNEEELEQDKEFESKTSKNTILLPKKFGSNSFFCQSIKKHHKRSTIFKRREASKEVSKNNNHHNNNTKKKTSRNSNDTNFSTSVANTEKNAIFPSPSSSPSINNFSVFSSMICLSLLDPEVLVKLEDNKNIDVYNSEKKEHQIDRRSCKKIVYDSFEQHMRSFLPSKNEMKAEAKNRSLPVDSDDVSFFSVDYNQISQMALNHMRNFEYKQAADIYRILYKEQLKTVNDMELKEINKQKRNRKKKDRNAIYQYNISYICNSYEHQQLSETMRKLYFLNVHIGRPIDAMEYCQDVLKIQQAKNDRIQATAAIKDIGLVYFSANDCSNCLMVWKEALQRACMTSGYEHPLVATLLNNIGCLHYQRGDYYRSLRALEESLGLQRQILSTNCYSYYDLSEEDNHDNRALDLVLRHIAVTMGNIAMIFIQNHDYDNALSMLEEALPIQESVTANKSQQALQTIIDHMKYVHQRQQQKYLNSFELPKTIHRGRTPYNYHDTTVTNSFSSPKGMSHVHSSLSTIFGDADGIPTRGGAAAGNATTKIVGNSKLSLLSARNKNKTDDYLLLGSLATELTPKKRVAATTQAAFDHAKEIWQKSQKPFFTNGIPPKTSKNSIPVDVDGGDVLDAELRLKEIHYLAMEHLARNEISDALDVFESALRSHREKYGDIHHLVGTGLHNCGVIYLIAGEYVQARKKFHEALDVRIAALGPEHPDVMASMFKIGLIQLAREDFEASLLSFTKILIQCRKTKSMQFGYSEESKILNNIGVIQYTIGNLVHAFRAFLQSYEIQSLLIEKEKEEKQSSMKEKQNCVDFTDDDYDSDYSTLESLSIEQRNTCTTDPAAALAAANSLCNLGFILSKQGRYDEALLAFEEALGYRHLDVDLDDPTLIFLLDNISYVKSYGAMRTEDGMTLQRLFSKDFQDFAVDTGCKSAACNFLTCQ